MNKYDLNMIKKNRFKKENKFRENKINNYIYYWC
jgi:hypothetical protein